MTVLQTLSEEIRALDTSKRSLRSFGYVVGLVLVGIALFVLWRLDWTANLAVYWLSGIGGSLIALGLIAPFTLRPIYLVWMSIAVVLGFVMTNVILTIVFFLVMTPIGLLMRLLGKDPMNRKLEPNATSYWIEKTHTDESPRRLEKYY